MINKKIIYSLLLIIFFAGLFVRTFNIPDLITLNTSGFFYSRANYLYKNGFYIAQDRQSMFPSVYMDNYPPIPAYFSVYLHKLFSFTDFYKFIVYMPVILYSLIFIFGYILTRNLFGRNEAFIFCLLFSIIPASVEFTKKGVYTEEALGVLLLLFFIYSMAKFRLSKIFVVAGIISMTLLILVWQIFVILYFGILILMIADGERKKHAARYLAIIILPLLFSHLIVFFIGNNYSPLGIFRETYLSIKLRDDPLFKIAFDRYDLRHSGLGDFMDEFSFFGFAIIFGFAESIRNIKKNNYRTALVFSILGIASFFLFIKLKSFALPFVILMSSIGLCFAYKSCLKNFRIFAIAVCTLLIIGIFCLVQYSREKPKPFCEVEVLDDKSPLFLTKPYRITLIAKNSGGNPFCDSNYSSPSHAAGGVHIEIENSKILSKSVNSRFTGVKIVDEPDINGISWFEAKFDCLRSNANSNVTFWIVPQKIPVRINYRCWIPSECRLPTPGELRYRYKAQWRNENCIQRNPQDGDNCKVSVYAGYEERQDYPCISEDIK